MRFRELKLRKDPDCPVCGTHPTVTKLIDYEQFCGVAPHQVAEAAARRRRPAPACDVTAAELKAELDRGDKLVDRSTCASRRSTRSTGSPARS